jgi:hypothetical protein
VTAEKRLPIRFGVLTALVWLAVAAGIIFLLWQVIGRLSASSLPISSPTPNQTQVNQTIAAIVSTQSTKTPPAVTQSVTPTPSTQPSLTPSSPVPSPKQSATLGVSASTSTPAVLCNQAGAGNPLDVTIPDDSQIPAGQSFVKTWKLVNTGTCTWTTSYSAYFFYGDRMGAPESVPLDVSVEPSQSVEISIEMVAPQSPGSYQGNWKLSNAAGDLFGIGPNGNLPFWVRIVVPQNLGTQTATPTITPTSNPTTSPTVTTTPTGQIGGQLAPVLGDKIDLDALTLNSGDEDLIYQVDENNFHWLVPSNGAKIGVFGSFPPSLSDCQSASMSLAPIAVESLPVGTFLCYTTNQARTGRMQLLSVNPGDYSLTLDLLTWASP